MIDDTTNQDKCSKCGVIINRDNFGDIIEAEEVIVCEDCSRKHELYIITQLNNFRLSKGFNDKLEVKKKILWTSEQRGNTLKDFISSYESWNEFELQTTLLDIFQTLLEKIIYPDLEIDYSKRYPELEKLRLEVREQQARIGSYLSLEEWIEK